MPFDDNGAIYRFELQRVETGPTILIIDEALLSRINFATDKLYEEPIVGDTLEIPDRSCPARSFVTFPLGDVNADGRVNVLDTLQILNIAVNRTSAADAFERYHADINGNGSVTVTDVLYALRKFTNPEQGPELSVWPQELVLSVGASGCILVGNAGSGLLPNLSITAPAGVSVSEVTPVGAVGRALILTLESGVGGDVVLTAGSAGERRVTLQEAP
jgi:hypothetical protein